MSDLRKRGTGENELRITFINEVKRVNTESMILAHEGAAMRLDPSLKSADLEFTAKLAQIAFSPRPLWMMMSVLRSRRRKPSTSKAAVKLRAGRSTSLLRV